jgi:hypothetical protein
MSSIDALSLRVPVRHPTLIGLDLPLTALIGIIGKRKQLLTTTPVLAQPNIEKPFDVYCDTSNTGIGGALMQDGRAIAYASQQLQRHEETTPHMTYSSWLSFMH